MTKVLYVNMGETDSPTPSQEDDEQDLSLSDDEPEIIELDDFSVKIPLESQCQ